ncbi:Transposase IS4 [Popillia japonica]|uniref:Transposase IS4 n=1 Tax=Popillia japonica TaxID=7064 RepID=A0AAW1M7K9_POPJA
MVAHIGKGTNTVGLPLSNYYVKELTKTIRGSKRNVTMDNWFTSVPVAEALLKPSYNLTIVGTIRKDKPQVPPEMICSRNRTVGTTMFCFDKEKTLVSFKANNKKIVSLLSTMHQEGSIHPETSKPEIIHFYNSTKSGVDSLDQMCSNMNCGRKTRRWPLCVFYDMINIAAINAFVINFFNMNRANQKL